MQLKNTALPGVKIFEPRVFGDSRGFFYESHNARTFADLTGREVNFVPDNHSRSGQPILSAKDPAGKCLRDAEVFQLAQVAALKRSTAKSAANTSATA